MKHYCFLLHNLVPSISQEQSGLEMNGDGLEVTADMKRNELIQNWFRREKQQDLAINLFRHIYYDREEELTYSWSKTGKEHCGELFLNWGRKEWIHPISGCTPHTRVLTPALHRCNIQHSSCNWGYLVYTHSPASLWILQGQGWGSKWSYDGDQLPSIL